MTENIVELTQKLVAIDTAPEKRKKLSHVLEIIKSELSGFKYKTFEKNGIKSLLFYNFFPDDLHFSLIFNSHVDIIPAKLEQFFPRIEDGKIYGAGALDMKGALSAALCAFRQEAKNLSYPIGFQVVTDEETGGYFGTKHQIESGVSADFVIATEPTNLDIVYKAKGVFQFEIMTHGLTAHSAYPWRGENAVDQMMSFISCFQKIYKNPDNDSWSTTYNFSEIASPNHGYNKIPDMCRLKIDMRYTSEEIGDIEQQIKNILPRGAKMSIYAKEPCFYTNPDSLEIQSLSGIIGEISEKQVYKYGAHGTSDGRHYMQNAIEFGPVGGNIGADDEWVDIQSLKQYFTILCEFMNKREKVDK